MGEHTMALNKNQRISFIIAAILLLIAIYSSAFSQSPQDGRYLENGKWQPRNSRSTMDIPQTGDCQAEPPAYFTTEETSTINWEPDVRLSFDGEIVFDAAIHEGENGTVYIIAQSAKIPNDGFFIRSVNQGTTWDTGRRLFSADPIVAVNPQIHSDSNIVTMIFNDANDEIYVYSLDNGMTWSNWRQGVLPFGTGRADFNKNKVYLVERDPGFNLTQIRYSTDHGRHWGWHSNVNQITGEVDIGLSDGGLHIGQAGPGGRWCETYYLGYYQDSTHWTPSILMSSYDSSASFWPRIKAWDNNVVIYWTDYKYSPYSWTGDILMRRSTDNGHTWGDEQQVTTSHLALDKDMCERNDTLFLVYDEIVLDGISNMEEIFFNLSPDGGLTWETPTRLTYADRHSLEPAVAVAGNRIHVAFGDNRNDTLPGLNRYELYYKRGLISSDRIADQQPLASSFGLSNYPNPFNGKTVFEFNIPTESNIRLNIYDITGRLVKQIEKGRLAAGTHRLEWEGRDTLGKEVSSGLYIAALVAGTTEDVIKIAIVK
jgi:hypothetical protein